MENSTVESHEAFHNLFHSSCSMRAELDRLLYMAQAYPHFQEVLQYHYRPAIDSDIVRALEVARPYETERTCPPRHVLERLYVAAVQMLDKLDSIEDYRLAAVGLAKSAGVTAEQRAACRLVDDFNVNIGEVNDPARVAIRAVRPYLLADGERSENRDRKAAVAKMPGEREPAAI